MAAMSLKNKGVICWLLDTPIVPATGVICALLLLWESAVRMLDISAFLLPAPSAVLDAIGRNYWKIIRHGTVTAAEVAFGFLAGSGAALTIAVVGAEVKAVRTLAEPPIVMSQVVPKVAIAPLFLIWFGFGMASKVAMAALICFFPAYITAVRGLEGTDQELLMQARLFGQPRVSRLLALRVPAALPEIFSGLRASVLLASVGAIIAEFVGSDRGLGFLILEASGRFAIADSFAAIVAAASLGAVFFLLIVLLEHAALSLRGRIP